jgi:hypothetical protein
MCLLQLGAPCVCMRLLTDSLSILLITEKEDNEAKFNQLKDIWEVKEKKHCTCIYHILFFIMRHFIALHFHLTDTLLVLNPAHCYCFVIYCTTPYRTALHGALL